MGRDENRDAASRTSGSKSMSDTLLRNTSGRPKTHQTARSMSAGLSKGSYHGARV